MKECRVIFIMAMNIYLWHKITLRQESPLLLHTHTWFLQLLLHILL